MLSWSGALLKCEGGGGGGWGGRTFQKLRNLEVEILLERGITLKRGG